MGPAAEHESEVAEEDARAEDAAPGGAFEAEGAVGGMVGVGQDGEGVASLVDEEAEHLGGGEGDGQDVGTAGAELLEVIPHLAEVRPAGDSGQMPEKDQE